MHDIDHGVQLIEPRDHRVMPWKNGLGSTREIIAVPNDDSGFDWRLSIADVAIDGPFSVFPGHTRTIMLLEGAGMRLWVDGVETRIDVPFMPFDFSGDAHTECKLLAGAVRDFNIMSRRSRMRHEWHVLRSFPHPPAVEMQRAAAALFCAAGALEVGGVQLAAGDCLVADTARWFSGRNIDTLSADTTAIRITFIYP